MSQVREGPVVPERPVQPRPAAASRAQPVPDIQEMEVAVVGGLNYRAAPGLGGKILGAIPYRSRITVLDRAGEENANAVKGKWFKIRYQGKIGYVNSKYLREPGASQVMYVKQNRTRRKPARKTPAAITNIP